MWAYFDYTMCHNLKPSTMNANNAWMAKINVNIKNFTQNFSSCHMVDFGIVKWHHHKLLKFDGMDFFNV